MAETLSIGLPQMDGTGLSESWLFKHCGDLHWRALAAAFGVRSHELQDKTGQRLLAVFIAARARYELPLATVRENDSFVVTFSLARFGAGFYVSTVELRSERNRLRVELLQTFAVREEPGRNALRQTTPLQKRQHEVAVLPSPPSLLQAVSAQRRGAPPALDGRTWREADAPSDPVIYEPSPYVDFNGAGVLYFAVFPTIADTIERTLAARAGLVSGGRDWALAASTVAREIHYQQNLDVGEQLVGQWLGCEHDDGQVRTRMRLARERDGAVLAEVMTAKQLLSA